MNWNNISKSFTYKQVHAGQKKTLRVANGRKKDEKGLWLGVPAV